MRLLGKGIDEELVQTFLFSLCFSFKNRRERMEIQQETLENGKMGFSSRPT